MSSSLLPAIAGGALIGAAALAAMVFHGRIAGISGIVGGLLRRRVTDGVWRVTFLAGLVLGGVLIYAVTGPEPFANDAHRSTVTLGVAGLLVGVGSRMGSGCTSGHGVCGIGRLAPRSLVATLVFTVAGAAVVALVGGVA
jgi:uncharacterized membrane protein YedE/YeeE